MRFYTKCIYIMDFTTATHGKCILTGEHTVLRGGGALICPVLSRKLVLTHNVTDSAFKINILGSCEGAFLLVFSGLLEESLAQLGKTRASLCGEVTVSSAVPMGMGMGFSAALCVAVSRWYASLGWLERQDVLLFARQLENYFHGKSSGVDLLGASSRVAMHFIAEGNYSNMQYLWRPSLYLYHSGQVSVTAKCVRKVQQLQDDNPFLARVIDKDMAESVHIAKNSLIDKKNGFSYLCQSLNMAQSCFHRWGLVPADVSVKAEYMVSQGARAVKLTGAGGGGYLLGLWDGPPTSAIAADLIALQIK